jgi:hypothetical protein
MFAYRTAGINSTRSSKPDAHHHVATRAGAYAQEPRQFGIESRIARIDPQPGLYQSSQLGLGRQDDQALSSCTGDQWTADLLVAAAEQEALPSRDA